MSYMNDELDEELASRRKKLKMSSDSVEKTY
jgi:hypothetical protein